MPMKVDPEDEREREIAYKKLYGIEPLTNESLKRQLVAARRGGEAKVGKVGEVSLIDELNEQSDRIRNMEIESGKHHELLVAMSRRMDRIDQIIGKASIGVVETDDVGAVGAPR